LDFIIWPLVYFTALSNNASAPTIKAKYWLIQGSFFARQKTEARQIATQSFSDGR